MSLLSFVSNQDGDIVTVHTDRAGLDLLISELISLRDLLEKNECGHAHLFSPFFGGDDLTETKLANQAEEQHVVHHVKIYGWNEEWAKKHKLIQIAK